MALVLEEEKRVFIREDRRKCQQLADGVGAPEESKEINERGGQYLFHE